MSSHVLVVDDDATVAEVVVTYLRNAGYEATHTADGETALRAAVERWPDLVVLDLMRRAPTGSRSAGGSGRRARSR